MAKRSFLGRIADAGRKWLQRTFGGQSSPTSEAPEPEIAPTDEPTSQLAHSEPTKPAFKENDELEKLRRKFEPIITEANRRIELLQSQGLYSAAVARVEEEQGHNYFDIDEVESKGQLLSLATAARVFLNDETSTLEGARIYTAQLKAEKYRGQFRNQFNNWENKFKRFNINVIDEDTAKEVFRNYRKIEEIRAAEITGDGAYGSENLIIAMYDAQVNGQDSFMYGMEQLDSFYRKKTKEWQDRFSEANSVADILGLYESYDERGLYF